MDAPRSPIPDGPIPDDIERGWHARPAADCFTASGSRAQGLSAAQVAERQAIWGPNRLPHAPPPSLILLYLKQFRSPLIYLLLVATLVSLALGDLTDAAFILVVLLANSAIGATQEGRADAAARALEAMVHPRARVRRGGTLIEVDADELVPGDMVLLESGDAVPADLRLIETTNLKANESALTGEAMPVDKDADAAVPGDAGVADRTNMAHAGTMIVEGRALGLVVATGTHTQLGRIAGSLHGRDNPPPPLMRYLQHLARQIAFTIVALILLLAFALLWRGEPAQEIFLLAVALAVSAIPEGLPIAVTVALATATRRMAARNVVVRTLPAVEGLGSCTLIATDKTGTLTVNRLSVEAAALPGGAEIAAADWPAHPEALRKLAIAAAACNEAVLRLDGSGTGDSVDIALLRFADALDISPPPTPAVLGIHPYEPVNRFSSVAVTAADGATLYAKGAIERLAEMCDAPDPGLMQAAERLAAGGYRVIALAEGHAHADCLSLADPHGLRLIGCLALFDPLRPEAREAVAQCREAGIEVRMVTGDHPATARTIAAQLGLDCPEGGVLTGREIAALAGDPERQAERIRAASVYARTEPAQKLLIVETLQRAGHVVAVTGDGVNDAPALQAASIGVAMGRSGTDVARGAADLVLTDDNFASIVAGVEEGRVSYANVRKIAIFLLATGMAEILIFLGAVLLGLPMPLTAVQLLWANIVTEGVQNAALGFGKGDGDELKRRPRRTSAHLIDTDALVRMIPSALVMAVVSLLLFEDALADGATLAEARNAVLLCVVLFQNAFLLSVRSLGRPFIREPLFANPLLLLGIAVALGLHLAAMSLPWLQAVLGTSLPGHHIVLGAAAGAAGTFLLSEAIKMWRARIRDIP